VCVPILMTGRSQVYFSAFTLQAVPIAPTGSGQRFFRVKAN